MRAAEQIINVLGTVRSPYIRASMPKLAAAVAATQSNTNGTKVLCIGDSTTWGAGITPRSPDSAFPALTSNAINTDGVPASYQSIFGTGISSSTALPQDARVSYTDSAQWAGDGNQSVGGKMLISVSPNTATMGFTPEVDCDTFDIYYMRTATSGTFTVNLDGGATLATVVSANTPNTIDKVTVSGTLGPHTLNIQRTAGGTARIVGIVASNSTTKKINCLNMGWSGSKSADWASTSSAWSPSTVIPFFAADLTVICLTINDANNAVDIATYKANLNTIIDAALSSGTSDVMLMTGVPSNPASFASQAVQRTYCDAMREVAVARGLYFIDMHAIWVDYTTSKALNRYGDSVHPNIIGYTAIRDILSTEILRAATASYSPAPTYDSDALALFAVASPSLNAARKTLINNTILSLKALATATGSAWSDMDRCFVMADATSQIAPFDWKNPARSLTPTSNPTFTADRGHTGNGSSSYLASGFTPSVDGVKYTRDDASMWVWSLSSGTSSGVDCGNVTAPRASLTIRNSSTGNSLRMNDNTNDAFALSDGSGFFGGQRTASNAKNLWRNGTLLNSVSTASTGLPTQELWILGGNSGSFSTRQMSIAIFGASMSGVELDFYNIWLTYMQGVGAA